MTGVSPSGPGSRPADRAQDVAAVPASIPDAVDPATYALGLMVEEMGETLKLIGKSLRFGFDSPGPATAEYRSRTARQMIPLEVGDLHAAIRFAAMAGVFSMTAANEAEEAKLAKLLNPDSRDNLGRRLAPDLAQRIEARSDETPTAAQPEGREPDGEAGAPKPPYPSPSKEGYSV